MAQNSLKYISPDLVIRFRETYFQLGDWPGHSHGPPTMGAYGAVLDALDGCRVVNSEHFSRPT